MVGFAPPAGNADAAYRYFLSRGWTPAQAAGIVGNLQQESGPGLDPTIAGDGGNAFGIAQWNEMLGDADAKIGRPRQLFVGSATREVKPIAKR